MRINGKEIHNECQYCGEILTCELFRDGMAIGRERNNVGEMVRCQLKHQAERKRQEQINAQELQKSFDIGMTIDFEEFE